MRAWTRFWRSERGAVAAYFAILAPALIGMAALATEAGLWMITQRQLQEIADVAAYAGAVRSVSVTDAAQIQSSARNRALSSGLRATDTLTVAVPPTTGSFAGQARHVQTTVQRSLPRYLTRMFFPGSASITLTAHAVAGVITSTGVPICAAALATSGSAVFSVGGSGTADFTGCGLFANSSAVDAFSTTGAKVTISGACLYTPGGVSASSNLTLNSCLAPEMLQRAIVDPYASLPVLTTANLTGLPVRSSTINGPFSPNDTLAGYPGLPVARFDGGLTISGNNAALGNGLYIVNGGILRIGGSSNVTNRSNSGGVTFYLMNGAKLEISGSAQVTLKAYDKANPLLRTDPFAGLLVVADRTGTAQAHTIAGSAKSILNGVIYTPRDSLTFDSGSGTLTPCIYLIANKVTLQGSGTTKIGTCLPDRPTSAPPLEAMPRVGLKQ